MKPVFFISSDNPFLFFSCISEFLSSIFTCPYLSLVWLQYRVQFFHYSQLRCKYKQHSRIHSTSHHSSDHRVDSLVRLSLFVKWIISAWQSSILDCSLLFAIVSSSLLSSTKNTQVSLRPFFTLLQDSQWCLLRFKATSHPHLACGNISSNWLLVTSTVESLFIIALRASAYNLQFQGAFTSFIGMVIIN